MGKDEQGVQVSHSRYRVIPRVLCFVTHGNSVLLLKGAPTKRLWANKYNGVGGHVERGEDVHTAAAREIHEETGLLAGDVRLRGVINIDAGGDVGIMLFVFTAQSTSTQVTPSEEGALEWVPMDCLPTPDLVPDLAVLIPRLALMRDDDAPFFAHYAYNDDDELVITFAPALPVAPLS